MAKKFEELIVWQLARKLVNTIYAIKLGNDFGLADQIRRAAVSVMSNIAEGFERDGNREFIQFLYIAKGSCGEVRSQLYIAFDNDCISEELLQELNKLSKEVSVKLANLISSLKSSGIDGVKYKKIHRPTYEEELQKFHNEWLAEHK